MKDLPGEKAHLRNSTSISNAGSSNWRITELPAPKQLQVSELSYRLCRTDCKISESARTVKPRSLDKGPCHGATSSTDLAYVISDPSILKQVAQILTIVRGNDCLSSHWPSHGNKLKDPQIGGLLRCGNVTLGS